MDSWPAAAGSVTLSERITQAGFTLEQSVFDLERTATETQLARFKAGRSNTDRVTRSTALWTILQMDADITRILEDAGLSRSRLAQHLSLDESSAKPIQRTADAAAQPMHGDLAAALDDHLRNVARPATLGLADVALAILKAGDDRSRGLLPARVGQLDLTTATSQTERLALLRQAQAAALDDPSLTSEARALNLGDKVKAALAIPEAELWSRVAKEAARLDRLDQKQRSIADSVRSSLAREPSRAELATYPQLDQIRKERIQAASELRESLVKVFKFEIRTRINEALSRKKAAERYRDPISAANREGLHDDTRFETVSRAQLLDLINSRKRGSIGVAGPRGCGKTTLVRWLVDDPAVPANIRIALAAPATYHPREFLLHMYQRVCEEVIRVKGKGAAPPALKVQAAPLQPSDRAADQAVLVLVPVIAIGLGASLLVRYANAESLASVARLSTLGGALLLSAALVLVLPTLESRPGVRKHLGPASAPGILSAMAFVGTILMLTSANLFEWLSLRRAAGLSLICAALLPFIVTRLLEEDDEVEHQQEPTAEEDDEVKHQQNPTAEVADGPAARGHPVRTTIVTRLRKGAETPHSAVADWRQQARQGVAWAGYVSAATVALIAGVLLIVSPPRVTDLEANIIIGVVLMTSGGVSLLIGRSYLTRNSIESQSHLRLLEEDNVLRTALEARDRILFQRQSQSGWTGSAKGGASWMPLELTAGVSASISEARTPLGVPDIVDGIRSLVEQAGPAIICIDELDKIETPDLARVFLNEIKGVLADTPQSYFLLSMSEDAIASFERRGLPFRDVFDSTFDEVIQVPYLSLAQAGELLNGRVTNLSPSFIALAYCLSGGLPRDLIRMVDRIFGGAKTVSAGDKTPDLDSIAFALIHREVDSKVEATTSAIRQIPLEPVVSSLLRELRSLDACRARPSPGAPCLLNEDWLSPVESLARLPHASDEQERAFLRTLMRLSVELLGFLYYCRTLLEIFRVADDESLTRLMTAVEGKHPASLDELARARQNFAVNPYLAWEQVSLFRDSVGLTSEVVPLVLLPGIANDATIDLPPK